MNACARSGAVLIHGDDPRIENKLLIDMEDDRGRKEFAGEMVDRSR